MEYGLGSEGGIHIQQAGMDHGVLWMTQGDRWTHKGNSVGPKRLEGPFGAGKHGD